VEGGLEEGGLEEGGLEEGGLEEGGLEEGGLDVGGGTSENAGTRVPLNSEAFRGHAAAKKRAAITRRKRILLSSL